MCERMVCERWCVRKGVCERECMIECVREGVECASESE